MALPNDKRSLQHRLSRVATRMAQKFGNGVFTGVTAGAGASAGIPVSVLVNRIAGKKVSLDSLGGENASALSFTVIDTANGTNAATQDQLIAQTYVRKDLPVGLYGSPTALVMLAKLKSGSDSVDFLVIGDSNAYGGNAAGGWNTGLVRGLIRGCCAALYATPLFPTLIHPSSHTHFNITGTPPTGNATTAFYRSSQGSMWDGATSEGNYTGLGATMQSGNFYAPQSIKQFFDIGNSRFAMNYSSGANSAIGATVDFAYISASGLCFTRRTETATDASTYSPQNYIAEFHPGDAVKGSGIDTRKALTYRVVHALMGLNSPGSFPMHLWGYTVASPTSTWLTGKVPGPAGYNAAMAPVTGQPSNFANGFKRVSVAGATGITVSTHTWAADSARYGITIGWGWYGMGGSPGDPSGFEGNTWARGPIAVYLDSVHCNSKGFAVNNLTAIGGARTSNLSDVITSVDTDSGTKNESALRTILRETRLRQIEAGGSGNVIVWLNSGINDSTSNVSGDTYQQSARNIVNSVRATWDSLDYPENDLAFIITLTHPVDDAANTANVQDQYLDERYLPVGKVFDGISFESQNVLFANINELGQYGITFGGLSAGNSFNGNRSFYNTPTDTLHLQGIREGVTGGYSYLAELLVKRCLRYSE